jgi:hypothetical protein
MHDPQREIDAEVAIKCPRCGYIDTEAVLYGLQGEPDLSGECQVCSGPVQYPRDALVPPDDPEPAWD